MFKINDLNHTNNGDSMYYLNCFFIYSFLGFLFETIWAIITKSGYKSGFLYGPLTPIYGLGSVVILLLSHYFFMNLHLPRWLETIIIFFILAILLSCFELLGGISIEKIFHISFWDYSESKLSIGKYISLSMALIWGTISIAFIYLIHPLLDKLINKIPKYITFIVLGLFVFDLVFTLIRGIKK